MLTLSDTLHRHDPVPMHLRIHLVHPSPNRPKQVPPATVAAETTFKFRTRAMKISSLVAAAPAIGAILYWAQKLRT
jgi:hypothetical protein